MIHMAVVDYALIDVSAIHRYLYPLPHGDGLPGVHLLEESSSPYVIDSHGGRFDSTPSFK